MSKDKILVVEPDENIRNLINAYLTQQGYEVVSAADGKTAIQNFRILPDVIILENELPDMTGYEVCKILRSTTHTNHIPIVFFVPRTDRHLNTLIDLPPMVYEDYMTKPFDVEELRLRIQSAIKSTRNLIENNSISNRPKNRLIEHHLRDLRQLTTKWVYLNIVIQNFESFDSVYGWQAGDEVIRTLSLMLGDIVDDIGTQDDFIGHPQRNNFVVITHTDDTATFKQSLIDRFNTEIQQHYSFLDREWGYIQDGDKRFPLMSLAITEISHTYFGEQWDGTLPKQRDGDEQR